MTRVETMSEQMISDSQSELDGADDEGRESWGDYPLDTVFVRREPRTVADVVNRIEKGRYKLDPEFQRDFVWSPIQQARLIESCLMRIPLPVLYVAEDTDGKIIVVDGLQRLTTFHRYLTNQFALNGLGSPDPKSQIKEKKFEELPIHLQERIEDTPLTLYILDAKAPERAKLDIFERVNSGVPLTRQQMRNCLYSGTATRWLKEHAESDEFTKAMDAKLDRRSMRDREVVNRFCAFYILGYQSYKSDMDEHMAQALTRMNKMPESELNKMSEDFYFSMKLNNEIFGRHAFRKSLAENTEPSKRSSINISLFDSLATALAKIAELTIKPSNDEISYRVRALLAYDPFMASVSTSTSNVKRVKLRHRLLELVLLDSWKEDVRQLVYLDILSEAIDDHGLGHHDQEMNELSKKIVTLYHQSNEVENNQNVLMQDFKGFIWKRPSKTIIKQLLEYSEKFEQNSLTSQSGVETNA